MKRGDTFQIGSTGVRLVGALAGRGAYAPPTLPGPIDLSLDANEGPGLSIDLAGVVSSLGDDEVRRYSTPESLEREIGESLGVEASRVLVTAGGDEAIDRACRICLEPGRRLIAPVPTFEMILRSARMLGGEIVTTEWQEGAYPVDEVIGAIDERTSMIAVVSPNNPTGAVATGDDLRRLSEAAPWAVLLVDLAYTEFADVDLTPAAISLPNAVVVRTFSKAFGMAGLRVGYAIGAPRLIGAMRASGGPYPVSALSLAVARGVGEMLKDVPSLRGVAQVKSERARIGGVLSSVGASARESQGNFVLADVRDAEWVWRGLGGLGIGVRRFPNTPGLERSLRITMPGDEGAFNRLSRGLRAVLAPEAILLDMDGVLADVSGSYRRAIELTAESFGVRVTQSAIANAKALGHANNDWVLTHRLIVTAGRDALLEDVTARFEAFYHGTDQQPGLELSERLIPDFTELAVLSARIPLAVVTGRPRADCERFIERYGLESFFRVAVCMEDAPAKPDPAPVQMALEQLGVEAAWMVGDTPDDVVAARRAGIVPLGFVPPGVDAAGHASLLDGFGAARTLTTFTELLEMLS